MANEFKVKKGLIAYGSGSIVLDVQGSQGQLMSVTDTVSSTLFSVKNLSGTERFAVSSSGDIKMPNLTTTNQSNVVTIDTSTGLLYYTASSAFGGSGPVSAVGFITTGSSSANQAITGSLTISGSGLTVTGSIRVSGSAFINLGTSASVTNVVMVNPTTGQLYYTASSAISTVTSTAGFITTGSTAMPSQSISGSLTVSGSAAIDGTIRHDLNLYGSLNFTATNPSKNFYSFSSTLYRAIFLEYTLFLVDNIDKIEGPTKSGNIRIEVPRNSALQPTITEQSNPSLPTYNDRTGLYFNTDLVYFSALWNGANIDLFVYNSSLDFSAVVGLEYRLIEAE
jgi:hypothetical protein